MFKALVLILGALLFLAALPVRLGVLKPFHGPLRLGFLLGFIRIQTDVCFVFEKGRPALRLHFKRHTRLLLLQKPPNAPLQRLAPQGALRFLRRRIRLDRLDIEALVNLGDAAHSVLAASLLTASADILRRLFPEAPLHCRAQSVFSSPGFLSALGIVSCKAGDIMLAALLLGRDSLIKSLSRRPALWKSTPSKTS